MNVNTPTTNKVRRVGLSKKRSSSLMGSPCVLPESPTNILSPLRRSSISTLKLLIGTDASYTPSKRERCETTPLRSLQAQTHLDSSTEEDYLQTLENKLVNMRRDNSELENDILMWRDACREALLDLQSSLVSGFDTSVSCKDLSKRLGVWSVIKEQFSEDSEIVGSEDDDNND